MKEMPQSVYRLYVFKHILAILSDKGTKFPRLISVKEMEENIPNFEFDCLSNLMIETARCCEGWCFLTFDPESFSPLWQFNEPTFKQISIAVWRISSGDECKHVTIKTKVLDVEND